MEKVNKLAVSTALFLFGSAVNLYADAEVSAKQGGGLIEVLGSFLPLIVVFAIFYFLVIKPQQKKQEEHAAKVAAITVGDEVVTSGGIIGKVKKAGSSDSFIEIEVAEGVVVKVAKHMISEVSPKSAKPKKSSQLKETFAANKGKKKASSSADK